MGLVRRSAATVAAAVVTLALVAGCTNSDSSAGATGSVISVSSAKTLAAAYSVAAPGSAIELASGTYAPSQLRRAAGAPTLTTPVTLRAKTGATVVVKDLDVNGPALRVQSLHLTGIIRFRSAAVGSSLVQSTVEPGNVIVEGDNITISGNRLHAPADRDALDVGATDGSGPRGVRVLDNIIGPGYLTAGSTAHVDCLQVMSAVDLVVADNLLYDCPAQTLLVKGDLGPVDGVKIYRNELRGCLPRTTTCPAFMTVQIVPAAHPMQNILLKANSIAGALRAVAGIPGVVISANAVDRVEEGCEYVMMDNVVGSARCSLPATNLPYAPIWTSETSNPPDLHTGAGSPTIDQGAQSMPPDKDGRTAPCGSAWDAGAFEHC